MPRFFLYGNIVYTNTRATWAIKYSVPRVQISDNIFFLFPLYEKYSVYISRSDVLFERENWKISFLPHPITVEQKFIVHTSAVYSSLIREGTEPILGSDSCSAPWRETCELRPMSLRRGVENRDPRGSTPQIMNLEGGWCCAVMIV